MRRVFDRLNEMSFSLPKGWRVSKDKYKIVNGQGFFNSENYLSPNGQVVSMFEVHRDADEFLQSFDNLTSSYTQKRDGLELAKAFEINLNDFSFPVYILKGTKEGTIYIVHVFINCGDCLGCFIFNIDKFFESEEALIENNPIFVSVKEILETVE